MHYVPVMGEVVLRLSKSLGLLQLDTAVASLQLITAWDACATQLQV